MADAKSQPSRQSVPDLAEALVTVTLTVLVVVSGPLDASPDAHTKKLHEIRTEPVQ